MQYMPDEADWDDRLDPDLVPIVLAAREKMATRPPLHSVTPDQMRVRAKAEFVPWNADPVPLRHVTDFTLPAGPGGRAIPIRLYEPDDRDTAGCVVHFHGGGWTIGDLDLEDAPLRWMVRAGRFAVLSVDYRLAPEHPFPAAPEDGEAVFRLVGTMGARLDADPDRIVLSGMSAGANVALGTALRLRDTGGRQPCGLALQYGAYSDQETSSSVRRFGNGRYGLSLASMRYFWENYAGPACGPRHPHAVPLNADLAGLPPVFMNHAGIDVLADDSLLLADALGKAGVLVEHKAYAGAIHGFTQYVRTSRLAQTALEEAAAAIAAMLKR
ncbi:alpha/beta hydrolase [Sphingosinicella microcystinivorans]|uniref:alpha/beta hydrolase n=1 Tax=Sphingosinicella microcystinivorans TaxID=335406 RepID=UPI0022F3EFFA|nr:alpha/beta hydrolase [Sphingosinicella microcystinivorans]WBX86259.1 alpha/beta hydrolase [Sphingosinicella microcystinivorans]